MAEGAGAAGSDTIAGPTELPLPWGSREGYLFSEEGRKESRGRSDLPSNAAHGSLRDFVLCCTVLLGTVP